MTPAANRSRASGVHTGMTSRLAVLALAALAALTLSGGAAAAETKLLATVGPGFSIKLTDASGKSVTQLPAGEYEIEVEDLSDEHNFHLTGPGVDVSTEVSFVGSANWKVTLRDGTYRFQCDPHPLTMKGGFTVGAGSTPTTPPAVTPSAPVGSTLLLTVGPGSTIKLATRAGKAVKTLRAGGYTFVVRDRSSAHNAHLTGAGVNRATGVGFTGTRTFKLTLRAGTLRYVCDPHAGAMRGTVKVV